MHHLLIYEYVAGMAERRVPHREAHLAQIREQLAGGQLVMAGALGDPPTGGAFVFRDVPREHIEAFVAADPYVAAGLVPSHRIEVWNLV
jgi:uncharacterized protein YciI